MSAPAPPPPPLVPGTVVAGLTIEKSGTVMWLWVTFFIFGNVFAGFWLVLAALNAYPEAKFAVKQLLERLGLVKSHKKARKQPADGSKEQQEGGPLAQELTLESAPSAGVTPNAGAAATPATLLHLSSTNQRGKEPATLLHLTSANQRGKGGELGTPLRSHRSHKPALPSELCMEQTISPRVSLTLSPKPSTGARPTRFSADGGDVEGGQGAGGYGTSAAAAEAVIDEVDVSDDDDDNDSDYSDGSSVVGGAHVKLEWRNLCYAVKSANGLRLIVQGVYGCANPQELQGLMGPSGAGKSTLMDLLSKRTMPTGSEAAAAALQQQHHQSLGQRLKNMGSHRNSDATAASSSHDGGTGVSSPAVSTPGTAFHSTAASSAFDPTSPASGVGIKSMGQEGAALPPLESQLLVNGAPLSRGAFMKLSAYVPQHDNLVPTMTSSESLAFYAGIILPPTTSAKAKRRRIAEVLAMMGLSKHKDTLVGGTLPGGILMRGLSGGERKRLAIACGVVAGPSLVFLDEPTSGLDSFAALNVVLFLKNMATQNGATLIASLHQPRSAIWGKLDQVTLLANGRLMYTGPTEDLTKWFTSLGYAYDPSVHGMASDWALDLVSLGFTKPQQGTRDGQQQQQNGEAEQQQQQQLGSAASSGLRQRGLMSLASGLHGVGSMRYQSAHQQESTNSVCMMSSKQELAEAAGAFLNRLRVLHPDWFAQQQRGGNSASWANNAANGYADISSSTTGLSPIKTGAQSPPAVVRAASKVREDTDESPFMLQANMEEQEQRPMQGQREVVMPLQLTPTEVLEQRQDKKQTAFSGVFGAWRKYTALVWRELLITTRNPADMGGRMMTFTYVALLSGLVAWNLPGGADSIMSRISSCYAVLSFYLLMPFVFMSLFTSDKRFFKADTTARLYHPFQYYMAKVSVTLPFNMIVSIVFHLVYYGMIGMRHGARAMGMSCVISVLLGITAIQAVYCCAIVASSQDLAFVYAIAWTSLNLLVNPYMAQFNLYSLGWGFSWLRFFSPFNYAWQALVKIELEGRGFDCSTGSGLRVLGLIPDLLPSGSQFNQVRTLITNLGRFSTNNQCVASGDAVVDMYTSGLSNGKVVGILLGYFFLFMTVTYLVVLKSSRKSGPSL